MTDFKTGDIDALRQAAEQAWGDDTRHADFHADPLPAAGQCYVTSRWLADRYGGHVGVKGGHYFYVNKDQTHALDLTGDRFAHPPNDSAYEGEEHDEAGPHEYEEHQRTWRPGPALYKRVTHPLFKNYRIVPPSKHERAEAFKQRAETLLDNPSARVARVALDYAGDALPASQPQAVEDRQNKYWHDLPEAPVGENEYKFFYGSGDLHVSPIHSHDELRNHAGVPSNHTGPMAVGYVNLSGTNATWAVNSNIGSQALSRILKDYTDQVGWRWGGMTDLDGEPVGTGSEFAPKKALYWVHDPESEHTWLSTHLPAMSAKLANLRGYEGTGASVNGSALQMGEILYVHTEAPQKAREALTEYATDHNLKVAEVPGIGPGGGNFEDRLRNESPMGEDLEQWNLGNPSPTMLEKFDDHEMKGPFECQDCGRVSETWREHVVHRQYDHDLKGEEETPDSGFPNERPDMDQTNPPHFYEQPNNRMPWPIAHMVIYEPDPITEPLLRQSNWFKSGKSTWKMALDGTAPKDQIDESIPVIFDIRKDELHAGHPGQKTSEIPGKFTPGGIVEGEYQPGGKLILRSVTSDPYSVYHLADLWYWSFPHMELTGIDMQDDAGNTTKLAAQDVGQYIRQLALIDPAAATSWKALSAAGGEVYVVGGAVRDALLGKEPKDIDLLVRGLPTDKVMKALEALPGDVNLTGKSFGVYRYRTKGHEVEIALPRLEKSTGDKRVDFDVTVDHNLPLAKDLERRDFTVNSMAVNLDTGELHDPYGGAADIERRVLQTTHPSSFEEDPTRLVRALVASSRHGLVPTERVRHEIETNAHRLENESREPIQQQLDKLFASSNPAGAMRLAYETGLLKHLHPKAHEHFEYDQRNPHHNYPLGEHHLHVLERLQDLTDDPDLRLAGWLHDWGKPDSASGVCLDCRENHPDTDAAAQSGPAGDTCENCGGTNLKNRYYKALRNVPDENSPFGNRSEVVGADHGEVGATLAERWMRDMKYPVSRINRVTGVVRHHMYPDFSSAKGARKFLNRVGDHADDLMTLRIADREGKGTDEYQATKTPVLQQQTLVEQVRAEGAPVNQAALAVNGNDLIALGVPQGPQIGKVLQQLTDAVVEDPSLNNPTTLKELAQQYAQQGV